MPTVDKSVTILAFTTWEPVRVPRRPPAQYDDLTHGRADRGLEIQKVYDGIRVRGVGATKWARIYGSNLRDCEEMDTEDLAAAPPAEPSEAPGVERKARRG